MRTKQLIFSALILFTGLGLMAQKPAELVGTWGGEATLDIETEPNYLTLVLELKDGKLAGHMTGEYGTLDESPLSEITLEDGVFGFMVMASGPGGGEVAIKFKMKVSKDAMEGTLDIPDMGASGTWEASLQK
jgi:hypothetical protein